MNETFKNAVLKCIPSKLLRIITHYTIENKSIRSGNFKISFSQQGEDVLIQNYFEGKDVGFFIDIGACHPIKYSNTYALYLKGWSGINIEPNPDNFGFFNSLRSRDINLNLGVSDKNETLPYYKFNDPAVNTFIYDHAVTWSKTAKFALEQTIHIHLRPLHEIILQYKSEKTPIDLMSIDCEGMDYLVLKSNNWDLFRPKMLLIENPVYDFYNYTDTEIHKFLISNDYTLYAVCGITEIFVDNRNGK